MSEITDAVSAGLNGQVPPGISESRNGHPLFDGVTARNSRLRIPSIDAIGTYIDKKLPRLKADHISKAGAYLVAEANVQLLRTDGEKPLVPAALYLLGITLDLIDGAKQRAEDKRLDTKPTKKGMLIDVTCDQVEEKTTTFTLAAIANRRGHTYAAKLYGFGTITSTAPSLLRSQAEKFGMTVEEDGIGARPQRAIAGLIGIIFNKNRYVASSVATFLVGASSVTAAQRADVVLNGVDSKYFVDNNYDPEFMEFAEARQNRLKIITAGGMLAGGLSLTSKSNPEA